MFRTLCETQREASQYSFSLPLDAILVLCLERDHPLSQDLF